MRSLHLVPRDPGYASLTAYRSQIIQVEVLRAYDPPVSSSPTPPMAVIIVRGGARNFPKGG